MTPHLCALEGEFYLDVARLLADPEEDVVSVVEDHHVIVCEVVLSSEDHQIRGENRVVSVEGR